MFTPYYLHCKQSWIGQVNKSIITMIYKQQPPHTCLVAIITLISYYNDIIS